MSQFIVNNKVLADLFRINQYAIPDDKELIFIGVRGCLPVETNNQDFQKSVELYLIDLNYTNLRCTILQWKHKEGLIAAFPASTIPHINNIKAFVTNSNKPSNCLTTGYYKKYVKGVHSPAKKANWHQAFKQYGQPLAIRRTRNNVTYDNFDTIEVSFNCSDNIHCGWTQSLETNYSSAGCQVIMGIPKCDSKPNLTDNLGPWKVFKDNGYKANQSTFPYALFNSKEVYQVSNNNGKKIIAKMRFGSTGELVKDMQKKLLAGNYLQGDADGDFGKNTLYAVKKLQVDKLGEEYADCIVGPITAETLGLTLASYDI